MHDRQSVGIESEFLAGVNRAFACEKHRRSNSDLFNNDGAKQSYRMLARWPSEIPATVFRINRLRMAVIAERFSTEADDLVRPTPFLRFLD
jgi:hypothetical protein